MADASRTRVCAERDLPESEGRGFVVRERPLVLVRHGDSVIAFVNRCPHKGVSLDWVEGRFMSSDGQFLQCATHGALFRITDGVCERGPCLGDALEKVTVDRAAGIVWLVE